MNPFPDTVVDARSPAEAPPVTAASDTPGHPGVLDAHELFLNRETTWLAFNSRVLAQAESDSVPLLERVKFLAIVGSNLDEFIMKRIGGLKQQLGAGVRSLTADGRTPEQQIRECYELIRDLEARQLSAHARILSRLEREGIRIVAYEALSSEHQKWVRDDYIDNVLPLATPQTSDPAHPFPFVSNLSLNLLVEYRSPEERESSLARIKVPVGAGIARFVRVAKEKLFVPLESVMIGNLDLLFPGAVVDGCSIFRATRNANTDRDQEAADDLLAMIETEMRDRRFAPIVRLEVGREMPGHLRGMLAAELDLDEEIDVFGAESFFAMRDLMEIASLDEPDLRDVPFAPVDHPAFAREDKSTFHVIRDAGPFLVHHPYQSYATSVERFLHDASRDPKVRAIKATLYRTDPGSQVIDCLIEAARAGKQVAVVVELKARFEEQANIQWAGRLEEAGVHVTYGVLGLKTHCKLVLVVRKDFDGLRRYAHVGTGNYNADTARLYTDLSLFTCDPVIGQDLSELFNYLTTGYKPKRNYAKILPSPKQCKPALLRKIDREIENHAAGRPARIQIKTNALEDVDITGALYRASREGVPVELIVRDSCRIRPGLPGLSDSVRVVSLVGRFLEHSRIYCFANGGEDELYIGSADAMQRNLESRVEVLVPVEDEHCRKELRFILDCLLADTAGAWEMKSDGSYTRVGPNAGESTNSAQRQLVDRAAERYREATRLKRRGLRGKPGRRNKA